MKTALVLGATGLIGSKLLDRLLDAPAYSKVSVLVRRPLGRSHPKLDEFVTDFRTLDWLNADELFCAIGTTMKQAGSKEAFKRVDYDIPLQVAGAQVSAGTRRCIVVSSVGADAGSTNFYLRTKGELERDLSVLGFDAVHALRPSLLLGDRKESRPAERIAAALLPAITPLLVLGLRKYRPISADRVAGAMIAAAALRSSGLRVHQYDEIGTLAGY